MGELLFSCVIHGRCYVKKNTQKVVRRGSFYKKQNSDQYSAWESKATFQVMKSIPKGFKKISEPMHIAFKFYFKNHQAEPDLSNIIEGPQDLLKTCGVILDDKLVHSLDGTRKYFGDQNERVEIEVYRFKE